ncbi:hypothetical protein Hanom_Chr09g00809161 [Helianthus anomalus]
MTGCVWPKQNSRWPTAMLKKIHYKTYIFLPFFITFNHIFYTSSILLIQNEKMHPYNRPFDPNNPYAFQENNLSPPLTRPMPRPFFIHSSMPVEASYASYIGNRVFNRVFTNFPHTDDSIPTPFTQSPIDLSPTSIDLSQTETVPETQPPNDTPSASKPIKKRSYKKKPRRIK